MLFAPLASVDISSLRIEWPAPAAGQSSFDPEEKRREAQACSQLGEALLSARGPWGIGLFGTFGCYHGSSDAAFAGDQVAAASWTLRLHLRGKQLELVLNYHPSKVQERFAARVRIPSPAAPYGFDDKPLVGLVAAALLDALPAARSFSELKAGANGSFESNVPLRAGAETARPGPFVLFSWGFDPVTRLWIPHILGDAQLVGTTAPHWHLHLTEANHPDVIYAQAAAGPGQKQGQLLRQIKDRQTQLAGGVEPVSGFTFAIDATDTLLHTLAAGYVGVRIGRELVNPADSILPPATVIGIIGEFRGGILAGLRLFYDEVPRQTTTVEGQQLYLGWSRFVVGYGLGIDFDSWLTRLEIAPKIGIWSVASRLAQIDAEGNIENAPSPFTTASASASRRPRWPRRRTTCCASGMRVIWRHRWAASPASKIT